MKAKSIKGKTSEELKIAFEKSLLGGYTPTLAIIFISIKQDRKAIVELMQQHEIDIFGATSCGEFIDGHQSEGEIVVMLLDMPKAFYSILFVDIGHHGQTVDAAAKLSGEALQQFKYPAMLVCSTGISSNGAFFEGETFVNTLKNHFGPEKIFFGGMAGDDWTFSGSYVFNGNQETDFGIVALVLDIDKVSLDGMAITGWKPMGLSRRVTKSAGTYLYEIDGKPAIDMYFRYLGQKDKIDDKDFNLFKDLAIHYPLITKRASGETTLRTPMSIDYNENALVMDIGMEEDEEFWFTVPPDLDIAEAIIEDAKQLKEENMGHAEAVLIFSCAGRPPVLGPLVTVENDGLADVWNAPMAGFFTYGEYGRVKKGKQEFHSGACCWVALKENTI